MSPPIPNTTAQGNNRILDTKGAKKNLSSFHNYRVDLFCIRHLFEQPEVDITYLVLKSFPKTYADLLHVDILKNTR